MPSSISNVSDQSAFIPVHQAVRVDNKPLILVGIKPSATGHHRAIVTDHLGEYEQSLRVAGNAPLEGILPSLTGGELKINRLTDGQNKQHLFVSEKGVGLRGGVHDAAYKYNMYCLKSEFYERLRRDAYEVSLGAASPYLTPERRQR